MLQNSEWWAIGISVMALFVSFLSYRISKRATRSTIEHELTRQALSINEALVNHKIRGPYAHYLGIPNDSVENFTGKVVVLLHHVNFLRIVFDNRDLIDEDVVASYGNWVKKIVTPWIQSDEELLQAWELVIEGNDLYSTSFIRWLNVLVDLSKKPSGDEAI